MLYAVELMSDKVECTQCGVLILTSTALKTGGVCRPCKGGYRKQIEESQRHSHEMREYERTDQFRKLWVSLVQRVFSSPTSFEGLSKPEKLYFAVGLLEGEVYNGGFEQYFFNCSSSHYAYAEEGLQAIRADRTLELLQEAKSVLFPAAAVPEDTQTRRQLLQTSLGLQPENDNRLDALDREYWADAEGITQLLQAFAREHGLVAHGS